jgi:hypothetical protein
MEFLAASPEGSSAFATIMLPRQISSPIHSHHFACGVNKSYVYISSTKYEILYTSLAQLGMSLTQRANNVNNLYFSVPLSMFCMLCTHVYCLLLFG